MRSLPSLTSLLCALLALAGCDGEGESKAPQASTGSGPRTGTPAVTPFGGSGGDSDGGVDDDGGAKASLADFQECKQFAAAQFADEDGVGGSLSTFTTDPDDFAVTLSRVTWEGKCPNKTLVVYLSDGECLEGDGHELEIRIESEAITDGTVHGGENAVLPEPAAKGLKIRYRRPADIEPTGEWGTCTGASGVFTFQEPPETFAGAGLAAKYQLELTACDGVDNPLQVVNGGFNVTLIRSLGSVCPTDAGSP